MMKPCKHLDHRTTEYPDCTLITLHNFSCQVKHWRRNHVPFAGAPVDVQFCGAGRGRINGIFQCYNEGEMPCHEPAA